MITNTQANIHMHHFHGNECDASAAVGSTMTFQWDHPELWKHVAKLPPPQNLQIERVQ